MPAWTTSLLRELVSVPIASAASSTTTSRPDIARRRAIASPTTPAPTTTASTLSVTPAVARCSRRARRASLRHRSVKGRALPMPGDWPTLEGPTTIPRSDA